MRKYSNSFFQIYIVVGPGMNCLNVVCQTSVNQGPDLRFALQANL